MDKKKILITGATGFVGSRLCERLLNNNINFKAVIRKASANKTLNEIIVKDLAKEPLNGEDLDGIDTIIHLAARVHILKDKSKSPLAEFRCVNRDITLNLAKLAAKQGVKRFIFLSSLHVNGVQSFAKAYDETMSPQPVSDYALSKWEAEEALKAVSKESGLEFVIIRPPLVYGPNVGGNLARLIKAIQKGLPLPLASINNRRSLIALDNLVDFIICCVEHSNACNQTFLISDDRAISTSELIRLLALGMGLKARLLPLSPSLLKWGAKLLRCDSLYQQLGASLEVDNSKAKQLLGFSCKTQIEDGLTQVGKTISI